MTKYLISVQDYKEFFNKKFIIKKEYEDEFFDLEIIGIKNKNDEPYEYSIKWINDELEEEGYIYNINTSSVFALKSCYWEVDEE